MRILNRKQRLSQIISILDSFGKVTVNELVEKYQVSGTSIRNDLDKLEKKGLLKKVYGGAVSISHIGMEISYDSKRVKNYTQKQKIAKRASNFIQENMAIFLDAGTTCSQLIPFIKQHKVFVVTVDLLIASELAKNSNVTVRLLGGIVSGKTLSTNSIDTIMQLKRMHFDIAFIGCDSFTVNEFETFSENKAQLKQIATKNANLSVILADNSKFNLRSLYRFAVLDDVDYIVTDKKPLGISSQLEGKDLKKFIFGTRKNHERIHCNPNG